jgi:heptosyltransferase I
VRVHRFLLIRLGSLGDVIHAIPAAAALRVHFPDARIDWMVDPRYVELLDLVEGLDARVPLDPRRAGAAFATMRDLRGVRYDAVIDLQGLLKSAALARAVGAVRTIGFPRGHLREPLARLFYTHRPDPGDTPHVIFKNLALLEPLGVHHPRVEFPLDVPYSAGAAAMVARFGPQGYVLLNPGAAWPNKRWPAGRFAALAAAIQERSGLRSVVLWGPGEQPLAAAVADASGTAAEVAPETTITELFGLSKGARLMVSGDTGPLHIAAAVGTPIVSLFGPTRPERNGPWAAADIALSRVDRCSCLYRRRCRQAEPCINAIAIDEVMAAVERRLGT